MTIAACPTCGHRPRAAKTADAVVLPTVKPIPTWATNGPLALAEYREHRADGVPPVTALARVRRRYGNVRLLGDGSTVPTFTGSGRFEYRKGKRHADGTTGSHHVWDCARGGPVTLDGYPSKAHAVKVADALNGETPAQRADRIAARVDWTPALKACA